jgi:hypothetical protein
MRLRTLITALSLLAPLCLLAAEPAAEAVPPNGKPPAPVVVVRELDGVPPARDPWTVLERFPDGWDDRLREPKPAPSGRTRTRTFHFEGARSLGAAVDTLVCRHGLFLNYEDAPWVAEEDLQELLPLPRSESTAGGGVPAPRRPPNRITAPANERLDFEYAEDPETELPLDAHDVLESLVEAHRQQGGHGRFRVERMNDGIAAIVPSETLDERGRWVPTEPVLSRQVTFPAERRSVEELFDLVLAELNRDSPFRIGYGWLPLNAVRQTNVEFGAHGEAARDVLVRALRALPYRYYLILNFDPRGRTYILNVAAVQQRAELCPRTEAGEHDREKR